MWPGQKNKMKNLILAACAWTFLMLSKSYTACAWTFQQGYGKMLTKQRNCNWQNTKRNRQQALHFCLFCESRHVELARIEWNISYYNITCMKWGKGAWVVGRESHKGPTLDIYFPLNEGMACKIQSRKGILMLICRLCSA